MTWERLYAVEWLSHSQLSWERGYSNYNSIGYSLMPRLLPRKAEGGSGVLSDISCHMGWGLQRKECHIYILHMGLEFSDDLDCCMVCFTKV